MSGSATSTVASAVAELWVALTFVEPKSTDVTTPSASTVTIAVSALAQVTVASWIVSPPASITVAASVPVARIVSSVSQWGSIRTCVPSSVAPRAVETGAFVSVGVVGVSSAHASRHGSASRAPKTPIHRNPTGVTPTRRANHGIP